MNDEPGIIDHLRAWINDHQPELADRGYQIEFSESPSDRTKKSASVIVASPRRVGQLTLWETGEAELSLGDISSPEISEQHREITSQIGLVDATETLLEWLEAADVIP